MTKHLVFAMIVTGCYGGATPPPAPVKIVTVAPAEPVGPPPGYVEVKAVDIVPVTQDQAVLLLLDEPRDRFLEVYVDGTVASSIYARMHDQAPVRPLTHDLMDSVLRKLHTSIVKVQIDELRKDLMNGTYIGSVYLRANGRDFHVDARPSDASALAIGNNAPIYVAVRVLDEAGKSRDDVQQHLTLPPP